jgi:hypothetical protein
VLGERPLHGDPFDRATAQRDHRGRAADLGGKGIERGDDEPFLASAELLLALPLEEDLDGLTQLALEQVVGVDDAKAEALGDGLRRPGLARPHEADEDEAVMGGYRRHPMRSL